MSGPTRVAVRLVVVLLILLVTATMLLGAAALATAHAAAATTSSGSSANTFSHDSATTSLTAAANTRIDAAGSEHESVNGSPNVVSRCCVTTKAGARSGDDVVEGATRATRAPTTAFGRLKQDFLDNPDDWKIWSSHAEAPGTAHFAGTSIQTIHVNRRTGDRLVWHTVVSKSGRVIDDHPRPYCRARDGE